MKERAALALLVLCALPTQAIAQQRTILMGTDEAGERLYVLPDTVVRNDPAVTVWTRTDTAPGDRSTTRVRAQRAIYDCAARSITVLRTETYDAQGRLTSRSFIAPDDLETLAPLDGSPQQRSLALICSAFLGR